VQNDSPSFKRITPEMAEVYKNRLKKNLTSGLVGNGGKLEKWFLIFLQILSHVKKLKI
jgi:hypothetical protein